MSDNRMMVCPMCPEKVRKGEAVQYKKRYHHEACYKQRKLNEGDEDKRVDLIDYIMKLYGLKAPTGVMLKQIKEFKENNNYTYAGMRLTLWYFHEIKGNPVKALGVGIIPYVYNEARDYFIKTVDARKHMDKLKEDGLTCLTTERTVRVVPKELDTIKKEKIDISKLL